MNGALLIVLALAALYLLWKVMVLSFSLIDFWQAASDEDARTTTTARGTGSS